MIVKVRFKKKLGWKSNYKSTKLLPPSNRAPSKRLPCEQLTPKVDKHTTFEGSDPRVIPSDQSAATGKTTLSRH